MNTYEIRDLDEARLFLYQGLWLQRVAAPAADTVRPALEWALQILTRGYPLPPLGFVADLGQVAFGVDWESKASRPKIAVPNVPAHLLPTYEDHVLGKIYADWSFSHAADALRRYKPEDRKRGLAFLVNQIRERAGFPGVEFSPGVLHSALEVPPDDLLRHGYASLQNDGLHPYLLGLYEALIDAARRVAEVLGPEDLIELQQGTALDEEGERMAFRQVVQAALALEGTLPRHRVRPLAHRQEVPTRVLDEDTYPVGGFSSISNRGSIESLLHSQLAFIEDDRPDLFDVKYLRDELLYYSRDENQFLRRRRTFVVAFYPDLIETIHFKDAELPWQRGILLLAGLFVAVRKLTEWLSTDALVFDFVFLLPEKQPHTFPLEAEFELLLKLLREQVQNGTVVFDFQMPSDRPGESQGAEMRQRLRERLGEGKVAFHTTARVEEGLAGLCAARARRSLCHCLTLSAVERQLQAHETVVTHLKIDGPRPALSNSGEAPLVIEGEDALEVWGAALHQLLQRWI